MFQTTHRALALLLLTMLLSLGLAGCSTSKSEAPDEAPGKAGAAEPAIEEEATSEDAPTESGEKTEESAPEDVKTLSIEEEEEDGGGAADDDANAVEAKERSDEIKKDSDAPDSEARTTGGSSIETAPDLSDKKSRKRSSPATKGKSKKCPPDDKDCEEDPGYLRKRPSKL